MIQNACIFMVLGPVYRYTISVLDEDRTSKTDTDCECQTKT